jgi:hypothetical protein
MPDIKEDVMSEVQIELNYDAADQIPEGMASLYDEKDGKFTLGGVNGLKTQTDINNVQEALRKEREDHTAAQNLLKPWKDLKADEVRASLERIPELEAAAKGKLDDEAINEIVERRIGQKTGPLDRQIQTVTEERDTAVGEVTTLKSQILKRDMNEAVRLVANEMKVVPTAIPDVELIVTNFLERDETTGNFIVKADAVGVTPGVDIKQLMKEMQKQRPHWWPQSQGGGAGGAGGQFGGSANPFMYDGWNITEQGKVYREQGTEIATAMAKAAGTTVGGLRPPKLK